MLGKLQKHSHRLIAPAFAVPLQLLAHGQNVAILVSVYRHYFGRDSFEQAELIPLPYSRGRCTPFCSLFCLIVWLCSHHSTAFFFKQLDSGIPCLKNFFNDLNCFTFGVNLYLSYLSSFSLTLLFTSFLCFILVTVCLAVARQTCMGLSHL